MKGLKTSAQKLYAPELCVDIPTVPHTGDEYVGLIPGQVQGYNAIGFCKVSFSSANNHSCSQMLKQAQTLDHLQIVSIVCRCS